MQRREFLKYGGLGVLAAGGGTALGPSLAFGQAATRQFTLTIRSSTISMIDGQPIKVLAFQNSTPNLPPTADSAARVPGPVLRVVEGDQVELTVINTRPEPHGLDITGIPGATIAQVPAKAGSVNGVRTITFTAPVAGTYMYHDPSHASYHLYRLLGLHGAFIVHPRDPWSRQTDTAAQGFTYRPALTPYSMDKLTTVDQHASQSVSSLFNALGYTDRFKGGDSGKWVPCALTEEHSTQEKIWLLSQIDPKFNNLIFSFGIATSSFTTSEQVVINNWVPRYFTINGRSGFDLSEGEDVVVKNYIGEPTLLRVLNAGLCHHSTHIHGNHVMVLAHSYLHDSIASPGLFPPQASHRRVAFPGVQQHAGDPPLALPGEPIPHEQLWELDVWPSWPMQIRDVLLPLEIPPDMPNTEAFFPINGGPSTAQEPFPLRYVMHCHTEMSTTAAGGNYPQGLVTHWEIAGNVGGRAASGSAPATAAKLAAPGPKITKASLKLR
jgi:Multicopper oxidase